MTCAQFRATQPGSVTSTPPNNRPEKLKGDREGQYSIRINDQWRVCFRWTFPGTALPDAVP